MRRSQCICSKCVHTVSTRLKKNQLLSDVSFWMCKNARNEEQCADRVRHESGLERNSQRMEHCQANQFNRQSPLGKKGFYSRREKEFHKKILLHIFETKKLK